MVHGDFIRWHESLAHMMLSEYIITIDELQLNIS